MQHIVYCKYSNDRADCFKIKTTILINENGEKVVYKEPLTKEAQKHIKNIAKIYNVLSENYSNTTLKMNTCLLEGEKVRFEYLEGETLEVKLDRLYEEKKYLKIVENIQHYVETISNVRNKFSFYKTDEFKQIFGDVNLPSGLMSTSINNIDMIFSNIVINNVWNVLDYEWTFEFPIPINFTIYRAIYYYVHGSTAREELITLNLFKLLGISDDEIVEYQKMEKNFQKYIIGRHMPLWKLYEQQGRERLNLNNIIEYQRVHSFKNSIQVFYDRGEGYTEEDSYIIKELNKQDDIINIEVPISEGIQGIRIDPTNDYCVLHIEKIAILRDNDSYIPIFHTNGIPIDDSSILFMTNDPQIIVPTINSKDRVLILRIININIDPILGREIEVVIQKDIEIRTQNQGLLKEIEGARSLNNELINDKNILIEKDNIQNITIQEYREREAEYKAQIEKYERQENEYSIEIKNYKSLEEQYSIQIQELEKSLEIKQLEIQNLNSQINELDKQVDESLVFNQYLQQQITTMENTKIWKAYSKYRTIIEKR